MSGIFRPSPDTRLYAIGDIHGRKDLLERLLAAILRDSRRSSARRRLVVFLGDYVDRGPDSAAVVEMLRAGPPATPEWAGFRWICLRGNHEETLLRFLDHRDVGPLWLALGGMPTIRAYLRHNRLPFPDLSSPDFLPPDPRPIAWRNMQAALRDSLPAAHWAFLAGLPLCHSEGDYFLVHAGIRPGLPLERQNPADLLWIRGDFLDSAADFGKLVVHGHTIVPAPKIRRNRIGIDTGAFRSGRLTALVAEDETISFLST